MTETEDRPRELAEVAYAAFNSGNLAALEELLDPEVEVFAAPGLVNSGTFRGHDGFRRWLGEWLEAWESFSVELDSFETLDERFAIGVVMQRGVGRGSGLEIEMPIAHLWQIEDGRVVRFHLYATEEEARGVADRLRAGE